MSEAGLQTRTAIADDDEALRDLLRRTPLPGAVSMTMEREPSFFGGVVDALRHDVAFVTKGNRLMGCGSRTLKRCWLKGGENTSAYLSDLRAHPQFQRRGGWALRAGFRHLETLAREHPAAVTWTVVFEDNAAARKTLVGRSAGLPEYVDRGRLLCPVLLVPKRASPPAVPRGLRLEMADDGDFNTIELVEFLNMNHRGRPLAAVHDAADFEDGKRWPGLRVGDWVQIRRGPELVGCAAVWDLRAIRQVRVQTYRGWLRSVRKPLGILMRVAGRHPLPDEGTVLSMAYVSFLTVENDDLEIAALLLRGARMLAAKRGLHFLCVCLHEGDGLAPALKGLPAIPSHGRLYEVVTPGQIPCWPPGIPHIEPAAL